MRIGARRNIAVVGTGISGLSAAWLLNKRHRVTVYERAERIGGHSNTISVQAGDATIPVDTGFIVYNAETYPNLVALLDFLDVPSQPSDMSLAISLDEGGFEYSGSGVSGLFAQPFNALRPRFWSMLADLVRFYREASHDAVAGCPDELTLGGYLDRGRYRAAFRDDHLLPMAAAIWSAVPREMTAFPANAFLRFYRNHGLLKLRGRPQWRTVTGGSRAYVERLTSSFAQRIERDNAVREIVRKSDGVTLYDSHGRASRYDDVVIATHADEALALLSDPSAGEHELLSRFSYSKNLAALHTDATLMPRRRGAWASWNYIGQRDAGQPCVTYWMNLLQRLTGETQVFVTLNPPRPPAAGTLIHSEVYRHPMFDASALAAQSRLWSLQGRRNTWYCGAYFGAGFHEDGLQAGLAVAEQLGGIRRPWRVPDESGRIVLKTTRLLPDAEANTG